MSIRLNKSDKEDIARKARNLSPLNKKLEDAIKDQYVVAEKLRIYSLGGQDKADEYQAVADKIQKLSDALPDHVATSGVGVHISSYVYYLAPNTRYRDGMALSGPKIVSKENANLDTGDPLLTEIEAVIEAKSKIQQELREVEATVYASIAGITTVKKLLDTWPEAKELLHPDMLQPKAMLPAMQTIKLNKLIGLPIDKKEK